MSVVHERSNVVLRSPAEFAAAIPALLGFTPHASLVAVFLGLARLGRACTSMSMGASFSIGPTSRDCRWRSTRRCFA